MKLVSFIDDDGRFAPGLLLDNGDAIDLRGLGHDPAIAPMADILNEWDTISPLLLEITGGASHDAPTIAASEVRLGPPVPRPTKLSAVGLNYRDPRGRGQPSAARGTADVREARDLGDRARRVRSSCPRSLRRSTTKRSSQ